MRGTEEMDGQRIRNRKGYYLLMYTLCFMLTCGLAFSWYWAAGRTLIWDLDGWAQHYKALVYYGQYLRSIIRGIVEQHALIIPRWDFSIGAGSDVLQTLHYYVIGDPFAVLSVCVPSAYMYLYYNFMIVLRLYAAGLAFSWLCFRMGHKNRHGILAGAMTYVFCFWALYNAVRHPYFLNPMIYLPLLIVGIEKILKRERPYLFIGMVALSALSNFYFFYMIVLVVAVYVAVRLVCLHGFHPGKLMPPLLRIAGTSVLGVSLSGVVLLPVLYTMLNDARMSTEKIFHLFYPLSYYDKLPAIFGASGDTYWLCMGFSMPVFLAMCLLLRKKHQKKELKILLLICLVVMVFPVFGQALNGFSYMSNRWCWALALLSAYILTSLWPSLMELKAKDTWFLFLCTAGYVLVCVLLEYSRTSAIFIALLLAFILLFVLQPAFDGIAPVMCRHRQTLTTCVVLLCILNSSFWKHSAFGDDYASAAVEASQANTELRATEAAAVAKTAEADGVSDTFFRYSGNDLTMNAGMLEDLSSTQYYWSLTNPYTTAFRKDLALLENTACKYENADNRAALTTLSSVRYYAVKKGDQDVPYGFSYVDTVNVNRAATMAGTEALKEELQTDTLSEAQENKVKGATAVRYDIYRNDYFLPLGYTYDSYMTMEQWQALSAVEKEEAMLQTAVLATPDTEAKETEMSGAGTSETELPREIEEITPVLTSESIPYELSTDGQEVTIGEHQFVVTSSDRKVTLTFEGEANCETYLIINGLTYTGTPRYDLYFGDDSVDPQNLYNETNWQLLSAADRAELEKQRLFWSGDKRVSLGIRASNGTYKTINYYTPEDTLYNDRHSFAVNLNYSEEPVQQITIEFPDRGIYTFEDIQVVCQPMADYGEQIEARKADQLEQVVIGTDQVSGRITLDTPKLLCMTIPYSEGWTATADGQPAVLYQANEQYMALALTEGSHEVTLSYTTPFLREGELLSGMGIIVLVILIIAAERRRCRR